MDTNSLKLTITFRKQASSLPILKNIKQFFEDFHKRSNIGCVIKISNPKSIETCTVYESMLYEMNVTISYKKLNLNIQDLFFEMGKKWCNSQKKSPSTSWLRLVDRTVLQNNITQQHLNVDVKELAFGSFPSMQHFMEHSSYMSTSNESGIISEFWHNLRHFTVYLQDHKEHCKSKMESYKLKVEYESISRVLINVHKQELNILPAAFPQEPIELYFQLQHIPLIYRSENTKEDHEQDTEESLSVCGEKYKSNNWERSLNLGCHCHISQAIDKIGKCLVLKLVIPSFIAHSIIERLIQRCPENTFFHFCNVQTVIPSVDLKDFELFPHRNNCFNTKSLDEYISSCQYAWDVLLGRSLEIKDQVLLKYHLNDKVDHWSSLKEKLMFYCARDNESLRNTLYQISEMVFECDIFVFEDALLQLFDYYHECKLEPDLPPGMCMVPRAVITPSRIIPLSPSPHFDNRIIREYGAEYMLRISIQDEDSSSLTYAIKYHSDKEAFFDRVVRHVLEPGLRVGGRLYKFLASSNSQLRAHGFWMFADDNKGNSAESIRQWMGDFSMIKGVAKYMARMGQCLTKSHEVAHIELPDNEVVLLDEIMTDDRNYTFTDGIGMISKRLAQEIRRALAKRLYFKSIDGLAAAYEPVAFQIRYKGYKGMVVESPTLEGRKMGVRPSMKKFDCSTSSALEIVKVSGPRPLFLSRPLITILEQLGVPPSAFLKLHTKMAMKLSDSLMFEKKACKIMKNLTSLNYPWERLLDAGINVTQEPFFRSLVFALYKTSMDRLQSKTRIAIPHRYGRNMMGVIDETKTLRYGEVFVQYSEEVGNIASPMRILNGTVVVTTNPCMHPGDVKKLKAIDVPALHHIKDCIVFPANGERPHPDEMAGSDLDGDEFVVIWMKDLRFPGKNHRSMDYTAKNEVPHPSPVNVNDMIDFLSKYIQGDNIGSLGNAHLAWADSHPAGIFSEICMEIAKKYSLAVDFAKSGNICSIPRKKLPKTYPDFMDKGAINCSYRSEKTLGLLYRLSKNINACIEEGTIPNLMVEVDSLLEYPGWEMYRKSAEINKRKYSERVKYILRKYGLASEGEALSGHVGKVRSYNEGSYEKSNLISLSRAYLMNNIHRYRAKFCEEVRNEWNFQMSQCELQQLMYRKASAWYMVTYSNSDDVSVLSFPWVVSDILAKVRKERLKRLPEQPPLISPLTDLWDIFQNKNFISSFEWTICFKMMRDRWDKTLQEFPLVSSPIPNEKASCCDCVETVIEKFLIDVVNTHTSSLKRKKFISATSSFMDIALNFMKYISRETYAASTACQRLTHKAGFSRLDLQFAVPQTYVQLALLRCGWNLSLEVDVTAAAGNCGVYEGDPINISVDGDFEKVIIYYLNDLKDSLIALTGVKNVFIHRKRKQGKLHIFIHSIGKPCQRWKLKETIMDPKYISSITSEFLTLDEEELLHCGVHVDPDYNELITNYLNELLTGSELRICP